MSKDLVFIVSGGRTGTQFLGMHLASMVKGASSVHEPDINFGLRNPLTWRNVRTFGAYHMLIGRALGRTGARMIGKAYLTGKLKHDQAVRRVRASRRRYVDRCSQPMVIEANGQWVYLLPVLRDAFPLAKIVCITRSRETWVRSWMRKGDRYTARDTAHETRISPVMLGEEHASVWRSRSIEEKLEWEWNLIDQLIRSFGGNDPLSRRYAFEDLFLGKDRTTHFENMLRFIAADRYPIHFNPAILDRIENATRP